MQQSDLDGIERSGQLARDRGLSFHENPHFAGPSWKTEPQMFEWQAVASAWAAGWLKGDAGRDKALANLMRVKMW